MDAENKILHLKAAAAGVIAIFTALWGWFGWVVLAWVALMLADWLVGSILGNLPGITLPFTYSVLIGPLVIVWYIIGELGSLAEHAVTMGANVPSWLMEMLEAGKNAVDAAGDQITAGDGANTTPRA